MRSEKHFIAHSIGFADALTSHGQQQHRKLKLLLKKLLVWRMSRKKQSVTAFLLVQWSLSLGIQRVKRKIMPLTRTLCNFGTHSGCYQDPPQGIAWGLEKAPIKRTKPPVSVIGSRRAFCVLFCGRKEGTTIASDSYLRGDTMLNISMTHWQPAMCSLKVLKSLHGYDWFDLCAVVI